MVLRTILGMFNAEVTRNMLPLLHMQISVAKGDKVLFTKQGSSDVPVPDGEVCFVQQRSIMAKLS